MIKVTKEQFYQYINQGDICVYAEKELTYFETRNRLIVGYTEGYNRTDEERFYALTEAAFAELIKDREKS